MTSWDLGGRRSTYDRFPVAGGGRADACVVGWADVAARLRAGDPRVVVVDCYPGVLDQDVKALAAALGPDVVIDVATRLKPPGVIDAMVEPDLGDDPVFGRLTSLHLADFFDDVCLGKDPNRRLFTRARQQRIVGQGAGDERSAQLSQQ